VLIKLRQFHRADPVQSEQLALVISLYGIQLSLPPKISAVIHYDEQYEGAGKHQHNQRACEKSDIDGVGCRVGHSAAIMNM
jgi:hypothetical protein